MPYTDDFDLGELYIHQIPVSQEFVSNTKRYEHAWRASSVHRCIINIRYSVESYHECSVQPTTML